VKVVLEGVVGSTLYGMAHEGSDVDTLGVFVSPTDDVLSLGGVKKQSVVQTDPDMTHHELSKFIKLCLGCNPTVLELLYLPDYTVQSIEGKSLVLMRDSFLSESAVRNAFGGYAYQQIVKLRRRGEEGKEGFGRGLRYEKHVRHCFRLMIEAEQLLRYGTLDPVLTEDEIGRLMWLSEQPLEIVSEEYLEYKRYLDTLTTDLPAKPDEWAINEVLLNIRYNN
jgi:uncharacterized protein